MAIGAVGFNPFDYDPKQLQAIGGVGTKGAGGAGGAQRQQQELNPFQGLDPSMLAQKKAGFEVGLGGTNNPDNHKIFFAA